MEPEARLFLKTIVQTMSMTLLWMLIHTWLGIRLGLLFFDEGVTIWKVVYWMALVGSGIWVYFYIRNKWRKVPRFGNPENE